MRSYVVPMLNQPWTFVNLETKRGHTTGQISPPARQEGSARTVLDRSLEWRKFVVLKVWHQEEAASYVKIGKHLKKEDHLEGPVEMEASWISFLFMMSFPHLKISTSSWLLYTHRARLQPNLGTSSLVANTSLSQGTPWRHNQVLKSLAAVIEVKRTQIPLPEQGQQKPPSLTRNEYLEATLDWEMRAT